MDPIISVIVPVYKVEPYLRKCIDSIRNQTFQDLEIILVDDGSPDGCGRICDEYAAADSRIRVIHKENGGLSSARNAGMDIARGEIYGFVDSDDWVEPDMFEFLYNNLIKEDADISACGKYEHIGKAIYRPINTSFYAVFSSHDAVRAVLTPGDVGMYAWNKLYRKQLFSEIRFPEGRLWEDTFIMVRLMDCAKKVVFHMQPKYHYLRREGSITLSPYRPEMRDLVDCQAFNHYVCEKYPDLAEAAEYRYLWAHFFILDTILLFPCPMDKKAKQDYIRFLRNSKTAIFRNRFFSKAKKLALTALCIHESLYTMMLIAKRSRFLTALSSSRMD